LNKFVNCYLPLIIKIANKNYEDEITIIVDWENDDSNNEYDSAIGVDSDGTNPVLSIPISISFEQFKG